MRSSGIFNSNSHWKLISFLSMNGTYDMNLGELANNCGISKGMASIALRELEEAGLVERRNVGNSHIYNAVDGPLMRQIKKTIGLSIVMDSGLIEIILEKDPYVNTIALYGSFAKGEQDTGSDVDILILSSSKKEVFLTLPRKIKDHDLNVSTFSPGTWYKLKREEDTFHASVSENHLILHGSGID